MSAMKRHLENKIAKLQEEKRQNKAIIVDAFFNNEISQEHFKSEMNALDLAEKTIKELDL
jgi:cystathionine beta-lyase family protein involved in aluminum resistance